MTSRNLQSARAAGPAPNGGAAAPSLACSGAGLFWPAQAPSTILKPSNCGWPR